MATEFPAYVLVSDVVSNELHVIPPHLFLLLHILRFWIRLLGLACINSICNGKPYVYQQDSTPSYKVQIAQEWMTENLHDHITSNI